MGYILKYITSPVGIIEIITSAIGAVTLGLVVASWPRDAITENPSPETTSYFLKFAFFFGFSISATLGIVGKLLWILFSRKDYDSRSKNKKTVDVAGRILIGVILVIVAGLFLEACISQYNLVADLCDVLGGEGISRFDKAISLALPEISSAEDDAEQASLICSQKVDSTDTDSGGQICRCAAKYLLKFNTTVAAGAFAALYFLGTCAAGLFYMLRLSKC